jgi:hypothetical protein
MSENLNHICAQSVEPELFCGAAEVSGDRLLQFPQLRHSSAKGTGLG